MTNYEIADHFALLSKLMDIHGEDSFRTKSYSIAAYNIERLPGEAAEMDDATLASMKGIGASTAKRIRELLNTGKLQALEDMLARTPPGILDMLKIKGLGPKKIAVIWMELGIESLGELEYACNENRLVSLKGFGAKTQESVLQNIAYMKQNAGFYLWAEAEAIAGAMLQQLQARYPGNTFALTGDVRRQCETVEHIAIVTDVPAATLSVAFGDTEGVTVSHDDEALMTVTIPGQPKLHFHFTDAERFYRTLFETTGSEAFMTAFKEKYTLPDAPASEDEIFTANGLPVIPAMMRETAEVLQQPQSTFEGIIVPGDIKGIIHSHSKWSDGVHTLEQMAIAARDAGLEYLVISDHSQTAVYADGLKPERVAEQHQEIDALNARLAPFRIFKSIESDILGDGSLDYADSVLATFDLVIASVHSNLKMTEEKAMERVLRAIRNPYTTILGHPTGRLLLSRKGYPLDHKTIIDACKEHDVVIEINAHPRRLDMDWRWIAYAQERGVLLSVDPDAHSIEGYRDTYYGVMVAQKGGLLRQNNLSSYTRAELEAFLEKNKEKRKG
ncbi:helix-hairpin-helix domain-containing protein [Nemorincola caseinilytica]|uniref:Helix-hairpin-helix domain-containing protein n=1 Tax=Nemorincola caseinilytica TaxID=2054315 RepID=A0ABP8NRN7_9BACT